MLDVLIPILLLLAIGALCAVLLTLAAVFFAAAIVLGMLAAKSENLILWLLSIAAISVAIMVDDNKNRR